MKICSNCGASMADNMNFCTQCGSSLANASTTSSTANSSNNLPVVPPPLPPGAGGVPAKPKRKFSLTNLFKARKPNPSSLPKKPFPFKKLFKRIGIAIVVMAIGVGLWINHQMNAATYLTFSTQGVLFPKCGTDEEVNIDYDGYIWELAYKPSWVEIDEHANSFTIKCQPNTTGQDRQDHITIKSGKITQALPIGQYGAAQSISLSKQSIETDRDGDSFYVRIQTDGINPEVTRPDFCSISNLTKDGFTINVSGNDGYHRSGSVVVKEDGAQAYVSISQKGKCSHCGGDGTVNCNSCWGQGGMQMGMFYSQCSFCGGRGSWNCSSCDGSGYE